MFGNLRDARELIVSQFEVLGNLRRGGGTSKIDCVGDGFERVVDLVRDGGCKPSGGGELLGTAKGFFGAQKARGFGLGG